MSTTETIYINGIKKACTGGAGRQQQCYQVKSHPDGHEFGDLTGSWINFYEDIIGFDYTPGYIYKLRVSVDERPYILADASTHTYTLLEVLEKTPMPENEIYNNGMCCCDSVYNPLLDL
jgi:heat shock protein HslJ